jgi:hypothetical protein
VNLAATVLAVFVLVDEDVRGGAERRIHVWSSTLVWFGPAVQERGGRRPSDRLRQPESSKVVSRAKAPEGQPAKITPRETFLHL